MSHVGRFPQMTLGRTVFPEFGKFSPDMFEEVIVFDATQYFLIRLILCDSAN